MKQKIKFTSSNVVEAEESQEIFDIARKRGIKVPSTHLGFFKTVYAKIEEPNLNGIRLAEDAVYEALPGIIGSQVNFEHFGAGFLCGTILDAWVNAGNEIEVVYSFFKSIYPEEYEQSLELIEQGKLSVSFELLSEKNKQEHLADGTIRLHDIDFQGMGHLMDNPPAYPKAKVYEFAKKCKQRLSCVEDRELVCASTIEKACDDVISEMDTIDEFPSIIYIVTTSDDDHFHIAELDMEGNGRTVSTEGNDKEQHTHNIMNWQIQEADGHVHSILTEIIAKVRDLIKSTQRDLKKDESKKSLSSEREESKLNEEQKKKVEELRAELGNYAKDVSDEELLNDEKVEELRKVKAEAEEVKEEETKEEEKEEPSELEQAQARITELESENAELKATLEAKDSEIEEVRQNAEKIGQRKVEHKDNEFVKDFKDEDYLNDEKITEAVAKAEKAKTIADRKEELKDNEFAKDFEDEDYLNDDKVELAKVKQEKAEFEAEKNPESHKATQEEEEKEEDMESGEDNDKEKDQDYKKVIANVRKDKNENSNKQVVIKRK